jgi:NarL family two-component system response regulator LiaR
MESMTNQPIKVLVVDNHAMVRKGIKAFLSQYQDISVVGEADNGSRAVELVNELKPDLVLIDPPRPGMDGIESIQSTVAIQSNHPTIVLTAYPASDALIPAIGAGAAGHLLKDAQTEELVRVIRSACAVESGLHSKGAQAPRHATRSSKRPALELDARAAVQLPESDRFPLPSGPPSIDTPTRPTQH